MEQKIAKLCSQVEVSRARERQRDIEHAGLKAQLDALLALVASGWIPPCRSDVVCPPRLFQSRLIQHQIYGQYRGLTDEHSSDEDHVANIPPHY